MRGASGGAAQEGTLLELEDTVVDVEGVRHHDGVRDALPVDRTCGRSGRTWCAWCCRAWCAWRPRVRVGGANGSGEGSARRRPPKLLAAAMASKSLSESSDCTVRGIAVRGEPPLVDCFGGNLGWKSGHPLVLLLSLAQKRVSIQSTAVSTAVRKGVVSSVPAVNARLNSCWGPLLTRV